MYIVLVGKLIAIIVVALGIATRPPQVANPTPEPIAPSEVAASAMCDEVRAFDPAPDLEWATRLAIGQWTNYYGCIPATIEEGGVPIIWGYASGYYAAHYPPDKGGERIAVDPNVYNPSIHFLPCVMAHELGHAFGFTHGYPLIMDPRFWSGRVVMSCTVNG